MDDTVTKLSINRLIIMPFTIHPALQTPKAACGPVIARFASYGDIVNYNTKSHANFFLPILFASIYEGENKPVVAMTSLILPAFYAANSPSNARCEPESLQPAVR
jgi:hypothetical protein